METLRNYSFFQKSIGLFLLSLFFFSASYGDNVTVSTLKYDDSLIFEYLYEFEDGSPESIIAIEKPKDAEILQVFDSLENQIKVNGIGDFFRIQLPQRDIDNLTIQFSSKEAYKSIFDENELKFYVNSNLKPNYINVNLKPIRSFTEVTEVFPRKYEYLEDLDIIQISQEGSLNDNLFQVTYEVNSSISPWLLGLLFAPILFFVMLFLLLRANPAKNKKEKDLEEVNKKDTDEKNVDVEEIESQKEVVQDNQEKTTAETIENDEKEVSELDTLESQLEEEISSVEEDVEELEKVEQVLENKEKLNEEKKENKTQIESVDTTDFKEDNIEEYIQKYLTENEQDVIRVIRKNEGIIQQEILDNLPIITKSTLSKIITKLEGKRILERVRVGKINKLYLGEKLLELNKEETESENDSKENSQ